MAVYLLALGAALLFGLGSVVQQRVASVAPPGRSLRPSLLLWLVRQPVWLIGLATAVVGNVFSGAALGLGSVALVQPLLVARLLFAIPLSAAWSRQRLALRDVAGMFATAGGLAVFLAVGRPTEAKHEQAAWWEWAVLAAVILALTAALVHVARALSPAREATMLGAGAGMMFALQSGFTHTAVGGLLGNGVLGLLLNWSTYAVALAAISGTLLAQSAYEMAPLAASYPTLAAVEPLTGIAIGVGILGSTLAFGIVPLAVFVLGLAVMTFGIYLLATSGLVSGHTQTMQRRHDEELLAEVERQVDDALDCVESTTSWLERCVGAELPGKPGLTVGAELPGKPGLAVGAELPGKPGLTVGATLPGKPGLTVGAKRPPRAGAVRAHQERLVRRLTRLDAALARLEKYNTRAEQDFAGATADKAELAPEDRALVRYHEENRDRERRMHRRAGELRARAARQLGLSAVGQLP